MTRHPSDTSRAARGAAAGLRRLAFARRSTGAAVLLPLQPRPAGVGPVAAPLFEAAVLENVRYSPQSRGMLSGAGGVHCDSRTILCEDVAKERVAFFATIPASVWGCLQLGWRECGPGLTTLHLL